MEQRMKKGPTPRNEVTAETKISFRVTPGERSKIHSLARNVGKSTAQYCRDRALGELSDDSFYRTTTIERQRILKAAPKRLKFIVDDLLKNYTILYEPT